MTLFQNEISQFEGYKRALPTKEEKETVLNLLSDISKAEVKMRMV